MEYDKDHIYSAALAPTQTIRNRAARWLWGIIYIVFFRTSPRWAFGFRAMLLRAFGAKIGNSTHVYPKSKIWAPWNLTLGNVVAIADDAEIYNTSQVTIQDLAVISQHAYLCCGSHRYKSEKFEFFSKPIFVKRKGWVAARAIVLPGVTIGESAVVAAGAVVVQDVDDFAVVAGNPAKLIKHYEYIED